MLEQSERAVQCSAGAPICVSSRAPSSPLFLPFHSEFCELAARIENVNSPRCVLFGVSTALTTDAAFKKAAFLLRGAILCYRQRSIACRRVARDMRSRGSVTTPLLY